MDLGKTAATEVDWQKHRLLAAGEELNVKVVLIGIIMTMNEGWKRQLKKNRPIFIIGQTSAFGFFNRIQSCVCERLSGGGSALVPCRGGFAARIANTEMA